jgi:hypothetical protein
MNFKKRVNGSWIDTPSHIHKTDTDTLTTLPAVLYPNDITATVGLKGNTIQNGTPTPSNPVYVNGVGERTANLFDKSQAALGKEIDGLTYKDNSQYFITGFIPVEGGKTYYKSNSESSILLYHNADYEETVIHRLSVSGAGYFTIPSGYNYIVLNALIKNIDNVMINAGSTPLPYEPYGYKIPILSNSTTTPVYLGEVETTRKIKKLVLDGTEDWVVGNYPMSNSYQFYIPKNVYFPDANSTIPNGASFCTHFINQKTSCGIAWGSNFNIYMLIDDLPEGATANDFKAYLSAQYSAGTPVTIWYPLETETTGIVNEPLMRIGDYADEVSNITIPTIVGKNTFDVETTLKPSEASINYTGWHDTDVKEYISDTSIADWEKMSIAQMENHTIQKLQGGNWV